MLFVNTAYAGKTQTIQGQASQHVRIKDFYGPGKDRVLGGCTAGAFNVTPNIDIKPFLKNGINKIDILNVSNVPKPYEINFSAPQVIKESFKEVCQ